MRAMKFGVGQSVRRVEDVRLVNGRGNYASDYAPEGALDAVFLRSPHAHAKFSAADIEDARSRPARRKSTAARRATLSMIRTSATRRGPTRSSKGPHMWRE